MHERITLTHSTTGETHLYDHTLFDSTFRDPNAALKLAPDGVRLPLVESLVALPKHRSTSTSNCAGSGCRTPTKYYFPKSWLAMLLKLLLPKPAQNRSARAEQTIVNGNQSDFRIRLFTS